MSGPTTLNSLPVTSKAQLIDALSSGCKPKEKFRIGTEHEKFVFYWHNHQPVPYEGENGIGRLLERIAESEGWEKIIEAGHIIGLKKNGAAISLEPGGQFELSGAPLENLHQTRQETKDHLALVQKIAADMGIGFLLMGFTPDWTREQVPWMPKGRYKIMREYMPHKGHLGLDMMQRTATVQVNLDFSSEADMVQKIRVGLNLQYLAMALFANSPFCNGLDSHFLSYRGHVWSDTDPDRTGHLPFVFEDGFGFEAYVDYLLDVPMYFVYREGTYIDASGLSFRDFLHGNLPILPGEIPIMSDWLDHITTAFPDVRLKQYLEMRGADAGPWRFLCALPAFWVGLLYDAQALDAASQLTAEWTEEDRHNLRNDVPRMGLHAMLRGRPLRNWALEFLSLARGGLVRRHIRDEWGENESQYLDVLFEIVASGHTRAERMREIFMEWPGTKISDIYERYGI